MSSRFGSLWERFISSILRAKKWLFASPSRSVFIGLTAGVLITAIFWLSSTAAGPAIKQEGASSQSEPAPSDDAANEGDSDTKTMPPLLGLRVGEFEEKLLSLGVDQWNTVDVDSDQPAGVVVDTEPGPGEQFSLSALNDGVLLKISKGKPNEQDTVEDQAQTVEVELEPGTGATGQTTMPDLIGLTKQQASSALGDVGIRTYSIKEVPSSKPFGTVILQSHSQGTVLDLVLFNRKFDPNQANGNHIEFSLSTGYDQAPSSTRITSEDSTIAWGPPTARASWGFYSPSVKDGILTIRVDVNFDKTSKINLEPAVAYATINGKLRVGFLDSVPRSVDGPAGKWIAPINFQMKISNLGINEPETATLRFRVTDGSETYIETLRFTFGTWK